jgi:hypothetical protein
VMLMRLDACNNRFDGSFSVLRVLYTSDKNQVMDLCYPSDNPFSLEFRLGCTTIGIKCCGK